jgi:hypothetical protein
MNKCISSEICETLMEIKNFIYWFNFKAIEETKVLNLFGFVEQEG